MKQSEETDKPIIGRPNKYGEETQMIGFRVPKSHVPRVKKTIQEYLKKLEK